MKLRILAVAVLAALACGCSGTSVSSQPLVPQNAKRAYSGTASVGDFLSINLDATAMTLTYKNYSNGDSGTIPYTVNADGTYAFNDPTGNLKTGYEVPNYGMLIEADKTGPTRDTPALITAVEQGQVSLATWAGHGYNYLQFRTSNGGMEAGVIAIDAQDNVTHSGYSPYMAMNSGNPASAFSGGVFQGSQFQEDPSGTFMTLAENNGTTDYIFGAANGVFVVDTGNGAILSFQQSATKAFDPAFAGSYKSVYYEKIGAVVTGQNQESGTPDLGHAMVTVSSLGQVAVTDAQGKVMLQARLTAVADAPYLYGSPGELQSPCYGLFTFRVYHGNQPQDVFATFVNGAMLFSSFNPVSRTGTGYDYFYGVGLK